MCPLHIYNNTILENNILLQYLVLKKLASNLKERFNLTNITCLPTITLFKLYENAIKN